MKLIGLLLISRVLMAQALVDSCQTVTQVGTGSIAVPTINTLTGTNGPATLITLMMNAGGACASGTTTDGAGNSWHCAIDQTPTSGSGHAAIWYSWDHSGAPLVLSASDVITFTGNGVVSSAKIIACAFNGTITSGSPLHLTTGLGNNGNTDLAVGPLTTTAGELVISAFADSHTSTPTVSSGTVGGIDTSGGATGAGSYLTAAGGSLSLTWTGTNGGGAGHAAAMASFVVGPTCRITTSSLTNPVIGTAYSATLATSNCVSPTFSLQSGALPLGLTLSGAGVISGTPANIQGITLTRAFVVTITDTVNGASTQSLSATVSKPALPSGNPVLTGISYVGYANSICAIYTTDTYSQITIQAGISSGGPYTTYSTGVLFPVNLYGTGSNGFGTLGPTTTCLIVPNSSTTYWAQIVADNDHSLNGGTQTVSTATSVTTAAATVSTRVFLNENPNVGSANDQFNAANGWTNTGCGMQGDTGYGTFVSVAYGWFFQSEDWGGIYCSGAFSGGGGGTGGMWRQPTADMLNPAPIGKLSSTSPCNRISPVEALAIGGWIYYSELQFGCGSVGFNSLGAIGWNILKSSDQFASTIRPQDNVTDQFAVSQPGIVLPTVALITGTPTVSGTAVTIATTAAIAVGTRIEVYAVTCSSGNVNTVAQAIPGIVTASSSSAMTYTLASASGAATCTTSGTSIVAAAMESSTYLAQWVQTAGGSQDTAPHVAGMDTHVYSWLTAGSTGTLYLARIRREHLQLQRDDFTEIYKGARSGADGLVDTASTGVGSVWDSTSSKFANAMVFSETPYKFSVSPYTGGTLKPVMEFIPDANRFVLTGNTDQYAGTFGGGDVWWDTQYPWGQLNYAGRLNRNVAQFPYHSPAFCRMMAGTYTLIGTSPYQAWVQVLCSGTAAFNSGTSGIPPTPNNPSGTRYGGIFVRGVSIGAATPTTGTRPYFGYGARQMPSKGLLAAYLFKDLTGGGIWADASGNGHNIAATGNQQPNTDRLGDYHWAAPTAAGYPTWAITSQAGLSTGVATAFTQATFADCFQHSPATSIMAAVSGEIVSQKGTSDYILARATTTDTWQVKINNTAVGSPIAVTDNTLGCILTTWDGTTANSYLSSAIGSTLPLTPTATVSIGGTMSAGALFLGPSTGTTNAHVIHVFSAVWDHAMTAAELIHARAGLAVLMVDKGTALP